MQLREKDYMHGKHPLDGVHGIPRGGHVLAVMISHITGLKYYPSFPMSARVLVVDDIVDTGFTMNSYINQNFATASLLWKEGCPVKPWLHEMQVPNGQWVVFPYETETSTKS
jgi:hypoxanthine phosphoribosyltransferase